MPNMVLSFCVDVLHVIRTVLVALAILIVVVALTYISFIFELTAFEFIFGDTFDGVIVPLTSASLLVTMALAFNAGKLALTWLMAARRQAGDRAMVMIRGIRIAIITNSALMTLLVCSFQITDAQAPKLLAEEKVRFETAFQTARDDLLSGFAAEEKRLMDAYDRMLQAEKTSFTEQWNSLDADLREESKVGGQNFKGNRYIELATRIASLETTHQARVDAMTAKLVNDVAALQEKQRISLEALTTRMNGGLSPATLSDYTGTDEAQNPALVRFVATINSVLEADDLTSQVVAVILTLLITLIIEMLPIALLGSLLRLEGPRSLDAAGIPSDEPLVAPAREPVQPSLVHSIAAE